MDIFRATYEPVEDTLDGLQRAYQITREREHVLRQRERQLGPVLHQLLSFLRVLTEEQANRPLRDLRIVEIADLVAQTKREAIADLRYDTIHNNVVSGDAYLRELVEQLTPLVDELPRWSGWENQRP